MVPAPFRFPEVFVELGEADASLLCQSRLCVAPERFDAVDMTAAPGELVRGMMDPVVPEAVQYQAVIRFPTVGLDHRRPPHPVPDDAQKLNAGAVRSDLGKHLSLAFQQADDRDLPGRTASALSSNPARPEVALVDLDSPCRNGADSALAKATTRRRSKLYSR